MTFDEIRALLLERAAPYAVYRRTTGVGPWCEANNLNKPNVYHFVKGIKAPTKPLLDALGLEWAIVPKQEAKPNG